MDSELWHMEITPPRPGGKYEYAIRPANGFVDIFEGAAGDLDDIEDLIRSLDPRWIGDPEFSAATGRIQIRTEPQELGKTTESMVRRARIRLGENGGRASGFVLQACSFESLELVLREWRSRGKGRL